MSCRRAGRLARTISSVPEGSQLEHARRRRRRSRRPTRRPRGPSARRAEAGQRGLAELGDDPLALARAGELGDVLDEALEPDGLAGLVVDDVGARVEQAQLAVGVAARARGGRTAGARPATASASARTGSISLGLGELELVARAAARRRAPGPGPSSPAARARRRPSRAPAIHVHQPSRAIRWAPESTPLALAQRLLGAPAVGDVDDHDADARPVGELASGRTPPTQLRWSPGRAAVAPSISTPVARLAAVAHARRAAPRQRRRARAGRISVTRRPRCSAAGRPFIAASESETSSKRSSLVVDGEADRGVRLETQHHGLGRERLLVGADSHAATVIAATMAAWIRSPCSASLRSASDAEVAAAYRELAKEWHPDRRGDDGAARMAEINVAYELLRAGAQHDRRSRPARRRCAARAPGGLSDAVRRALGPELLEALAAGEHVRLVTPASTWASPRTILAVTDRRLLWLLDDAPVARVRTRALRDVAEVARARRGARGGGSPRSSCGLTNGRRHAFAELRPHTAATIERHVREAARLTGSEGRLEVDDLELGAPGARGSSATTRRWQSAGSASRHISAVAGARSSSAASASSSPRRCSSTCARNASRPSASRRGLNSQRMSGGVPSALRCS